MSACSGASRFWREFDVNGWLREQSMEHLQLAVEHVLGAYLERPEFAAFDRLDWCSDSPSHRTCSRIIKAALKLPAEYRLRNALRLWSNKSVLDVIRLLKHGDQASMAVVEARRAAEREAREAHRVHTRKRKSSARAEEEALAAALKADFNFTDGCPFKVQCKLRSGCTGSCEPLRRNDRILYPFLGPAGTGTFDLYGGTVVQTWRYGKKAKKARIEFDDKEVRECDLGWYWMPLK
jgi:hypothetical protein